MSVAVPAVSTAHAIDDPAISASPTPAKLFQPARIGTLEIANRIVMPPMTTRGADAEGYVTEDTLAYYAARARGGVGLVTVEMASPEKAGRHRHRELGIYDDRFLPGLTRLAAAIHRHSAKASIQLGHGGGHTRIDICGELPIAPSAIPHSVHEGHTEIIVPEEMTHARIEETTRSFVDAAARARAAGFDAVEIHAAHGYLISQFFCPAENRRTDEYGGSLENRARFGIDIVRRIKAQMPGLPLIFRLCADDFFPGGLVPEEAVQIAAFAEAAGADAISVSAGHYRSLPSGAVMIPPMAMPDATYLGFAAQVKRAVAVPVIAVGRLGVPALAIEAVERGQADFIALGRALLADADWVNRARAGRPVRSCIACNTCVDGMRDGHRLHCLVNPATGRELVYGNNEMTQQPRRSGRNIAVIGAGPAGLSFASLAARDNRVTVFERRPRAGGAFRLAGEAPLFQNHEARPASLLRYIDGLERECQRLGVTFRFGEEAGPNDLAGFDQIVVAIGARYRFGFGVVVNWALRRGIFRLPLLRAFASAPKLRTWFYYKGRVATGAAMARSLAGRDVVIVGDAATPGKSAEAIRSAFDAALATASPQEAGREDTAPPA